MNVIEEVYNYTKHIIGNSNFQCDKNKKIGYRFYHSKLVANLCIYILRNISEEDISRDIKENMLLNTDAICIAALLHDISKDKKHHAEKAADNLKNIFEKIAQYNESRNILNLTSENIIIIENMIRKHGSHSCGDSENKYYIMLIQDADNISRYVDYLPIEAFNIIFDIQKDREVFYNSKKRIKDKHKNLNYSISKKILEI